MVIVKLRENFVIPELDDPLDNAECTIWLPVKEARDVARHLLNMNAFYTYLPVPGDNSYVEIIAFDDDLDKILEIEVRVKV